MPNTKKLGNIAEEKAVLYLQQQGLEVYSKNFYSRFGEIDIVLLQHQIKPIKQTILVFCEVRSRKNMGYGSALESISSTKQQKLRKTTDYFYLKNPKLAKLPARFDVIIVPKNLSDEINWITNAF